MSSVRARATSTCRPATGPFWKADDEAQPLLYLAWGARDFHRQPIPASRHEGWVCVLIEEGAPTMVVRRQAVRMPAGTLALIGPDCPFGWKGAASGQAKFRMWMWRSFAGHDGAHGPAGVVRVTACWRDMSDSRSCSCTTSVGARCCAPPGPTRRTSKAAASSSTRRSSASCSIVATQGGEAPDVGRARAQLDARAPGQPRADRAAVRLPERLAVDAVSRSSRPRRACSPLAFFHRARMERARDLLTTSDLSVKEVAHALGYEHANDLSRAYRRHFGEPPTRRR